MAQGLILTTVLLFIIFLILGVAQYKQAGHGKFYYSFAAASLLLCIYMISFPVTTDESVQRTVTSHAGHEIIPDFTKESMPPPDDISGPDEVLPNQPGEVKPEPAPPPGNEDSVKEKIIVPADEMIEYKVVQGDGLWSIAQRASVSVVNLKSWNSLVSDDIYIGQVLKIYGKNLAPSPPAVIPEIPAERRPSVLISHGSLEQKEIALTFDAGSDAAGISILNILEKHQVKATFFLTGRWVEAFPHYAKRIIEDGHNIGNHTYSHPDALKVDIEAFKADIAKAEKIIKAGTGVSPRPYFRFPYGAYNDEALKAAGEAGYPFSFHWTIDTLDWKQPSADFIVERISTRASNGAIILMHIGGINTPKAVDTVIPILKAKGYHLVTLEDMMN